MSEMRIEEVAVCPVWREADGRMTIGINFREDPPDISGWCIVKTIILGGERYRLVINLEVLEPDAQDDTLGSW